MIPDNVHIGSYGEIGLGVLNSLMSEIEVGAGHAIAVVPRLSTPGAGVSVQ